MTVDGTPIRAIIAPLFWFALAYVALEMAWWYAPALADMDALALEIAAEIAIFSCAVAIGGYLLKTQGPDLTKRHRHIFAFWSVAIMWTVLVAMTVVETLLDKFEPWTDLFAQIGSASVGLAIAAAVVFLVLFISNLYYFIARLILHFLAPPNRIAVQ